jgi:hypothetical protein
MTELSEEQKRNLAADWGDLSAFSDYRIGDLLHYRLPGGETASGIVVWITGPGESPVEGRDPLPLRYVVERHGWSGFPDVVYSSDVLSGEGEEDPIIEKCRYCSGSHYKGMMEYCPLNPNRSQP